MSYHSAVVGDIVGVWSAIVQTSVISPKNAYVEQWPQPGQQPEDLDRRQSQRFILSYIILVLIPSALKPGRSGPGCEGKYIYACWGGSVGLRSWPPTH
jgi:hypothetical protein